jgi:hypothetical protein
MTAGSRNQLHRFQQRAQNGGALSGTASADGPGSDEDKNGKAALKKKDLSKVLFLLDIFVSSSSSSVLMLRC